MAEQRKRTQVPGILGTNISQLGQLAQLEEEQGERRPKPKNGKKEVKGGVDDETVTRTSILAGLLRRLLGRE